MEGLYLGIEISDRGCSIAAIDPQTKVIHTLEYGNQDKWIPGFLCYDLEEDCWYIGSEASQMQGKPNCVILFRLLSMFLSGQVLNINEIEYSSDRLFRIYMEEMIRFAQNYYETSEILELVLCVNGLHVGESDALFQLLMDMGFSGKHIHIMNKEECFSHYIMSRGKESWSNACFMLDYNEQGLDFYDLSLLNRMQPPIAHTICEKVGDAPDISCLYGGEEDRSRADAWFTEFIEKKMEKRILNSVLITGEGFADAVWCENFSRQVLGQKSRRLTQTSSVFCQGAACAAYHLFDQENRFPHICICKDRISVTVSLMIDTKEGKQQVILASPGMNYREARSHMDLLLEDQKEIVVMIRDVGAQEVHKQSIDLSPFLLYHQDRIRIRLSLAFASDCNLMIQVEDLGFGDFYPSGGRFIHKEYVV